MATEPAGVRLRHALGRIRRRFALDRFDVFARRVEPADAEFAAPAGYRFGWAEPAEVAACDERHTELDARERREGIERLQLGHRCAIAFAGDVAVFTMWMNPRSLNVPGHIKRPLRADQAFIYKAFTSPDHRGRGLYEVGMRFVLADLARSGRRELLGYAHAKKDVSRKGLAALRFESIGSFATASAPGWRRTFVSRRLSRRLGGDAGSRAPLPQAVSAAPR